MAIEFTVEDGTGLTNSNAYISLVDFRQYWENRGVDYSSTADSGLQVAIIKATQAINNMYNYQGIRDNSDQALEFPRVGLFDKDNRVADVLPIDVAYACAEFARYALLGNDLQPVVNYVKSRSIGSVSTSYFSGGPVPAVVSAAANYLGKYTRTLRVGR